MSTNDPGFDKTMVVPPSGRLKPPPNAVLNCIGPPPPNVPEQINLVLSAVSVGRGDNHDVVLKVDGVSRNHARIYPQDGTWVVQDLGSTNGVYINKTRIEQCELNPGDILTLGKVHYKFAVTEARAAATPSLDTSDGKTLPMWTKGDAKADSPPGPAAAPTPPAPAPVPARPSASTAASAAAVSPPPAAPASQPPPGPVASPPQSDSSPAPATPRPSPPPPTRDQPSERATGSKSSMRLWVVVLLIGLALIVGSYVAFN